MKLTLAMMILVSTYASAATVAIHCNDKKTFYYQDLMDSPEEVGKRDCKDHDGYKSFTAEFAAEKHVIVQKPVEPKKSK